MTDINKRVTPFVALATTAVAIFTMVQCGGSGSPTGATTITSAVSGVALNATSMAAGGSAQGTVTLSSAGPTGGASISLSSSNPAVATVQTALTIPAGSSSATFTVTAVAIGTATITASLNGSSSQSPALTVTARSALASIALVTPNVVGGTPVTGTVALTAPAPAGGASVLFSGSDPVIVPVNVSVPAGSMSTAFTVETRGVGGTVASTITASYGGASMSVVLSVTRPNVATASFGVAGQTETETCTMVNSGNTLNCTFNGSTSTAPGTIVAWDWTYGVASTFAQTTSGPVLTMPSVNCSLLPSPPLAPGDLWVTLVVTLKVHDNLGNVSAVVTDRGARLLPQGVCGF